MMQLPVPARRPGRIRNSIPHLLTLGLAAACAGSPAPRSVPASNGDATAVAPRVGPTTGHLIVAGGGRLGPEIMDRFIQLAGGPSAHIVIVPTASESDDFPDDWGGYDVFRRAGVASVTVLHTRDPGEADTEAFNAPLKQATGVWIPGGRQWRLADAYLETRTLDALFGVLERGGVEGNTIMMAPGHERGFAFLRDAAVDQHLIARGRENDMLEVIARYPALLGIGLDEGTAIHVTGDRAEIVGRSLVAFYNTSDSDGEPYYFLGAGDVFDLGERRVIRGDRKAAPGRELLETGAR
jgi:cyanophycinase